MYIFCDFLWPKVQPHSDDSQMHVTAPVLRVYSIRLAPQCRAFSSNFVSLLSASTVSPLRDSIYIIHVSDQQTRALKIDNYIPVQ